MRTGRPPLPAGKAKSKVLVLRVTEAEHAEMVRRSGRRRLGKWARALLMADPVAPPKPVAPLHPVHVSITLRSGGKITLSMSDGFESLSESDREFVLGMMTQMANAPK